MIPTEVLWCANARHGRSNRWSFPPKVERFLRDRTAGKRVGHLFGGLARWGTRLDLDRTTTPHVLGDAWLPPFIRDAFDVVILDPPYMHLNQQMKSQLLRQASWCARESVYWFHTVWIAGDGGCQPTRAWLIRVGDTCAVRCLIEFTVSAEKPRPRPHFTRGPALKYNRWLDGQVGLPLFPEPLFAETRGMGYDLKPKNPALKARYEPKDVDEEETAPPHANDDTPIYTGRADGYSTHGQHLDSGSLSAGGTSERSDHRDGNSGDGGVQVLQAEATAERLSTFRPLRLLLTHAGAEISSDQVAAWTPAQRDAARAWADAQIAANQATDPGTSVSVRWPDHVSAAQHQAPVRGRTRRTGRAVMTLVLSLFPGNLIPEFERVVVESACAWFLMEEVPQAPEPRPARMTVTSFVLDHSTLDDGSGFGHAQMRKRRFSFGWRRDERPPDLRCWMQFAALELPNPVPVVACDARAVPVAIGGSGKVKQRTVRGKDDGNLQPWEKARAVVAREMSGGISADKLAWQQANKRSGLAPGNIRKRSWAECCALQGLPEDFLSEAPFTQAGKFTVLGNGVPLPMGRAIAKAVKRAVRDELAEASA